MYKPHHQHGTKISVFLATLGLIFYSGIVIQNVFAGDDTLSPTKDFYQWVNHDWLENTPIPDDKPGINNFLAIQKEVNGSIINLLASLKLKQKPSPSDQQIAILYDSYLDMQKRDALGIKPLQSELQQIDAAQNHDDIAVLFSRVQKLGVASPLIFAVTTDFKHSDRNIVFAVQSGLGIQRDNLLGEDERSKNQRQYYQELLQKVFSLASVNNADQRAASVVALEKTLASLQWSNADNRNSDKTYNVTDFNGLKTKASKLNLDKQMAELGMPTRYPFNVMQPSYVESFNSFFLAQDIETWKSYLKARLLLSYAGLLDTRFKTALVDYEIKQGMYDKEEPQIQQAVGYLNKNVGMLLGKSYIENTFDEGIKTKLNQIIHNIVDEYRVAVTSSPRMSTSTKTKALEKLDKMTFKIGYPDKWQDYTALKVEPGELVENHKHIALYEHQRNISKLEKPVDKNDWEHPPQDINAFYDPSSNSFVLLAGILHPPFFDKNGNDAEHYGGIGFVIGHEIGHGFDDQGSSFDGNGNLVNWWTEEDLAKFNKIKNALIDQANRYEILPGKYLKGELEIGEIIGDLSGAEISLRAYQKIIKAKNLDSQQAYRDFFKQLAQTWRDKMRDDIKLLLIDADPHPASEFRANGIVKNFDEFHQVFSTKPGDAMYLPSDQRVKMW